MIKNIIFDFGDIFINLDKKATINGLAALGVNEITEDILKTYHQYEKGEISTNEFINFYKGAFGISENVLKKVWNAVLLDFPKQRLDFLMEIAASKKYKLFLLSNTNELHIDYVKNTLGIDFYNAFKNCFHQFYLSHEIHFRKPDLEIYEFVLKENDLIASQTLFIDDLQENTDAAKQLGIHVWNLQPGEEEVTELFQKIDLL